MTDKPGMTIAEFRKLKVTLVDNLPGWFPFLNDLSASMGGGYLRIFHNHKDRLLALWGRQLFVFTYEFRHWCWRREFEGMQFYVFSGIKGTEIEVDLADRTREEAAPVAFAFVKSLIKELGLGQEESKEESA